MQIASYETIRMKYLSLLSGKNKKIVLKCRLLKFYLVC